MSCVERIPYQDAPKEQADLKTIQHVFWDSRVVNRCVYSNCTPAECMPGGFLFVSEHEPPTEERSVRFEAISFPNSGALISQEKVLSEMKRRGGRAASLWEVIILMERRNAGFLSLVKGRPIALLNARCFWGPGSCDASPVLRYDALEDYGFERKLASMPIEWTGVYLDFVRPPAQKNSDAWHATYSFLCAFDQNSS